jgi:hypothetical protein
MGFEAVQARTNRGCAGWEGCGITAAQKLRCTATGIAGRPPTLTRHLINQGVALTG